MCPGRCALLVQIAGWRPPGIPGTPAQERARRGSRLASGNQASAGCYVAVVHIMCTRLLPINGWIGMHQPVDQKTAAGLPRACSTLI